MAYDLFEYKEIAVKWGIVRLNIYKKRIREVRPGVEREIGEVLTGLHLDIEGQTDDIDAPIVKTSLTFSLIDAPEKNTENEIWGDWEHFFTSDATLWKVELEGKKNGAATFGKLWSGYITPDSYTETLQHHGVVTITARDNIGHLQDFDFDAEGNAEGMITPYMLINQAWEKIESPMILSWGGEAYEWPQADGVDIIDTYINVAAFKGKTWYDAVSETLYSLGLVMRYQGNNVVRISTLRHLPYQGMEFIDDLPRTTPTFMAYATRELVPAVKEINEEDTYDLQDGEDQPQVTEEDYTGTTVPCTINVKDVFGETSQKKIAVCPIKNASEIGWGNIQNGTLFFDVTRYKLSAGAEPVKNETFLAVNSESRIVWYGRNITCGPLTMRIEQGMMVERSGENILSVPSFIYEVGKVNCALKLTHDGVEYYYDGTTWGTAYKELNLMFEDGKIEQDIRFDRMTGPALLQLFIFSIDVDWKAGNNTDQGYFLGIKALNFSSNKSVSMLESNAVNTKYDEKNNVNLGRTPALAPAFDEVALPGMIRNGIFNYADSYIPTPAWKWYGDDEAIQLPVIVHKQLLCYYSKPNNFISGTIVNADMFSIRAIWTWKGKEHLLMSGSYNYLTGHVEGAQLREFIRYDDLFNN